MNTEDFCTYEQALTLKKLGFDWCCDYVFTPEKHTCPKVILSFDYREREGYVDSPTLWEAQKWLREEKYSVEAFFERIKDNKEQWSYFISNILNSSQDDQSIGYFNSYEEALSAGITECLKLLEKED